MDRPKILGQVNLAPAGKSILYSVPVDNTGRANAGVVYTVVGSIVICNTNSAAGSAKIWIMKNVDTAATANKELLVSVMAIAANSTHIINAGIVLEGEPEYTGTATSGTSAGIVVEAATSQLTFQAFGVEVIR